MVYRIVIAAYGAINILGGLMAYLMPKVQSLMSLIVGGITGLILLYFSWMAKTNPGVAFRGAAGLTLLLGGFWVYRINEVIGQGKSPMMAIGNLVLAVVVFAILGLGHMAGMKKRNAEDVKVS